MERRISRLRGSVREVPISLHRTFAGAQWLGMQRVLPLENSESTMDWNLSRRPLAGQVSRVPVSAVKILQMDSST
jgi:hypothetical protein